MMCRENSERIDRLSAPEEGKQPLQFSSRYPQSLWAQYVLLLRRNSTSYYRNPSYNCTRFSFGLILGVLFGSALWRIGQKRYTAGTMTYISHEDFRISVMPLFISTNSN